MTPRIYVSGIVQYNSTNASIGSNLRFRWEYRPGSEVFVVYTDDYDTLDRSERRAAAQPGVCREGKPSGQVLKTDDRAKGKEAQRPAFCAFCSVARV